MSFERTRGSIQSLSGTRICTDNLIGMLVDLVKDVYEENNIVAVDNMKVEDQEMTLLEMYNLVDLLLSVYRGNSGYIREMDDTDYMNAAAELEDVRRELTQLREKVAQREQVRRDLEAQRGHLLTARKECEAIEQRIAQLSDTALDAMAERKDLLQQEVAQREAAARELTAACANEEAARNALDMQVSGLNRDLNDLRTEIVRLQAEEKQADQDKAGLETQVADARQKRDEARQKLGDLPALSQRLTQEFQELQAQMVAMVNVVNSARNDTFLINNLFAAPGGQKQLTVEDYPDLAVAGKKLEDWNELGQWLGEMEGRIQGLQNVLGQTISALVQKAETITQKQEQ